MEALWAQKSRMDALAEDQLKQYYKLRNQMFPLSIRGSDGSENSASSVSAYSLSTSGLISEMHEQTDIIELYTIPSTFTELKF